MALSKELVRVATASRQLDDGDDLELPVAFTVSCFDDILRDISFHASAFGQISCLIQLSSPKHRYYYGCFRSLMR